MQEPSSRYKKGQETLHQIDGKNREKGVLADIKAFYPDLEKFTVEFAIGDIYSRPHLDLKTREFITISSLITQGQLNHLKDHIKAAQALGATKQEVCELILQLVVYAGFPKAINAMLVAKEVYD
ncbi:carboxymuconolactone decarboxylase family protein [Facilibium subflavum]|uniref:carboxymuconolactone decarboxylase family protein n=1 Tax=Facilibium subflavum TaxID=2219058 RepID=UPI000E64F941|nr:carboxymuconolactone decarboxylase family protein [Facilibium subflavum]